MVSFIRMQYILVLVKFSKLESCEVNLLVLNDVEYKLCLCLIMLTLTLIGTPFNLQVSKITCFL